MTTPLTRIEQLSRIGGTGVRQNEEHPRRERIKQTQSHHIRHYPKYPMPNKRNMKMPKPIPSPMPPIEKSGAQLPQKKQSLMDRLKNMLNK